MNTPITPHSSPITFREPPSRVLIRGVNWIGDAVMTMPAVQRLKELWPQANVTMHVPTKLVDLWRGNPAVNDIFDSHASLWASNPPALFDCVVLFPNSFRAARELYSGFYYRQILSYAGHWPRRYLLTDIVPETFREPPLQYSKTPPLQIHHYLGIVKYLGGNAEPCAPKIYLRNDELEAARKKFFEDERDSTIQPFNNSTFFALCPGAEYGPAKRWLPERFAEVAKRVRVETGCQWVLVGGPADKPICDEIAAKIGSQVMNLAGKTTLRELCCVLAQCKLLLTNDTGPMHLASALGTRVVAIFGSTDPIATGPYGAGHTIIRHSVECSPCFLRECPIDFRCMTRIGVEEVVTAVLKSSSSSNSVILPP